MPRGKASTYSKRRQAEAAKLRRLAELLRSKKVCGDVAPLHSAAEQLMTQPSSDPTEWRYDIEGLKFTDCESRIRPTSARMSLIQLSISVSGSYDSNVYRDNDPFIRLEIDLEKNASRNGQELLSAWHFDRHVIDAAKDDPMNSSEIHPLYHLQFGGRKISSIENNLGQTFFTSAPRLAHPPMEGFLAINFVLSIYKFSCWQELANDGTYINLIDEKMKCYWAPYFTDLLTNWSGAPDHVSKHLNPSIITP